MAISDSMPTIITIVEGDGEVQAVPILIRRIAEVATPGIFPDVLKPIRVRRDGILEPARSNAMSSSRQIRPVRTDTS